MSSENPSTVKFMMIQAGLVPKEVVQQLVNWRLLPEDSVELTGSRPINMEKEWGDVETFVSDLRSALDEEAKTIRETELEHVGEYRTASVRVPSDDPGVDWKAETLEVFVDKWGRIILPGKDKYERVLSINLLDDENGGQSTLQNVVRVERRFRGQKIATYVVYLEK